VMPPSITSLDFLVDERHLFIFRELRELRLLVVRHDELDARDARVLRLIV